MKRVPPELRRHRAEDRAVIVDRDVAPLEQVIATESTRRHHDVIDVETILVATGAALLDVRGHQQVDGELAPAQRTSTCRLGTEQAAAQVVPVLRQLPQRELAEAAGLSVRRLRDLLVERAQPHEPTYQALTRMAVACTREQALDVEMQAPSDAILECSVILER